ncbi:MAG: helix-turn-helix domain-containing protein [Actinomycetota bacterium]
MTEDARDKTYLGVRETALRLGVHENTVRNWAKKGILPTARIPGSSFHRFDAEDVERLRRTRGAPVDSVEEERRVVGPELVNATQLNQWANHREAQSTLPELVRRLLVATPGITNVSIRAGEGVAAPGWDGSAESEGTAFLPAGSLRFELGVGKAAKRKATADYEKRRDAVGSSRGGETFVFVTPRRWSDAEAWVATRREEGVFADVKVLDADDLEGWLQATPTVHYWISERLGHQPAEAETLERWWSRFQQRTAPPLPSELFLAGRDREYQQLVKYFQKPTDDGKPVAISVQTEWRDEALAFCSATIERLEQDRDKPIPVPLVIESESVWDRVVEQPGHGILIPLFEDPNLSTATDRGHLVVIPIGRDAIARGTMIELPKPHRQLAHEVLQEAGIGFDNAYRLAALARRSMPSFVRQLARDPHFSRPPWARQPAADILAPIMLVGAWTLEDADKEIVSRIANQAWPTVERELLHWVNTDDPPFVRSATQWHLASPEEAFLTLCDVLTTTDLERWREIAVEVLTEVDPRLSLPQEERHVAGLHGISRVHSPVLRRGLAEGIALIGSLDDKKLSDNVTGREHANRLVREILGRASDDLSGSVWHSLEDVLPLLAEAAPGVFLDAVHEDLDRENPILETMFQDHDQASVLFGSSPHTGLLWALEAISWSQDEFLDATRALARLADIDPGGRLANRPQSSLHNILVGWVKHNAVGVEVRAQAVKQICDRHPKVGWELILSLLPSGHDTALPPSTPRFRDWKPDTQNVPVREWIEYIHRLTELACQLAGTDPARWANLSQQLSGLPPDDRERVLDGIDRVAQPEILQSEDRLLLWETLDREAARHRRFPDADWSLDDEYLTALESIAARIEPKSNVERFAYLFDWHPDLPGIDSTDHKAYEEKLQLLRTDAVQQTLDSGSTDAIQRLARRSKVARHVGWSLSGIAPEEMTGDLLAWLDSDEEALRDLANGWAERTLREGGIEWFRDALRHPMAEVRSRRLALALAAPPNGPLWDALAEIDSELNDEYWQQMNAWNVDPQDLERAVNLLISHNRPWVAIHMLAMNTDRGQADSDVIDPNLLTEVLDRAMNVDPGQSLTQMSGYELGLLLDYLVERGGDLTTIARYEFVFFRILEHHREPKALFATLCDDAASFVNLVSRVYRGKNEPQRELSEQEQGLARQAWRVLQEWRHLPGQHDDGKVDSDHLQAWVRNARLAFSETDRADIGDEQIGHVLAASPTGADDIWPAEPVRELIETIGSPSMEAGFHIGVVNRRGVTSRGVFDGGQKERELADRYRRWAKATASQWPRTSRVLRRLADDYERQAEDEDARAAVTGDTR